MFVLSVLEIVFMECIYNWSSHNPHFRFHKAVLHSPKKNTFVYFL